MPLSYRVPSSNVTWTDNVKVADPATPSRSNGEDDPIMPIATITADELVTVKVTPLLVAPPNVPLMLVAPASTPINCDEDTLTTDVLLDTNVDSDVTS